MNVFNSFVNTLVTMLSLTSLTSKTLSCIRSNITSSLEASSMEKEGRLAFLRKSVDRTREDSVTASQTAVISSILQNFAPFASCLPAPPVVQTKKVKSPYDKFNGSFPFVLTVLGAPKVGKSELCHQLQNSQMDIHNKQLFRFCSMQPDVQISLKDNDKITLGVYDTSGLSDPELLQYILEGQKEEVKEDSSSPKGHIGATTPETSKKKKKKTKINSEGFIVMFDVCSMSSFEVACQLVNAIFEYFSYDPRDPTLTRPVTVFLVGNKTDSDRREVFDQKIRFFLQQQMGNVFFFETSAILNKGVTIMLRDMAQKIQDQRTAYHNYLQEQKGVSFWD